MKVKGGFDTEKSTKQAVPVHTEHIGREAPGFALRQQQFSRHSHGQHCGPKDQAGVQRSCQKRRGVVTLLAFFFKLKFSAFVVIVPVEM